MTRFADHLIPPKPQSGPSRRSHPGADQAARVMVGLLPCPMCANSSPELWFDDSDCRHHVCCNSCGVSTGVQPGDKSEGAAIAAWNRRAQPEKEQQL